MHARQRKITILVMMGLIALNALFLMVGQQERVNADNVPTTQIRSLDATMTKSIATGNIEPILLRSAVVETNGTVSQILVKAGDQVMEGAALVMLSTDDLEREVERARLELEIAQNELNKLQRGSEPGDVVIAQANLQAAQDNLVKVQAGATPEELESARKNLESAQAKLDELKNGPSAAAKREANASVSEAEANVRVAQAAFNEVRNAATWPEKADQSLNLNKATEEYNKAVATRDRQWEVTQSDLQAAESNLLKAQNELKLLEQKPTTVELSEAQARLTEAEQRLNKLQTGASSYDLEAAQLRVKKTQLDLETALDNRDKARIVAPLAGTVLEVKAASNDRLAEGAVVATLADLTKLKLTVRVSEVDVLKVKLDQKLQVNIDALPGQNIEGTVAEIAPLGKSSDGLVNYAVAIYIDSPVDGLQPGMTGSATLNNSDLGKHSWLVPANSVQVQNDQTFVRVVREESTVLIPVIKGSSQADWVIVQSPELKNGDFVVGSVATYVDKEDEETSAS